MAKHRKPGVSGCLSLLILLLVVHMHFLVDPCLDHHGQTAQGPNGPLNCRSLSCLCFFHAVYAPVEAGFSVITGDLMAAEEPASDPCLRLLAFDIFHPPRV
jgi:hypothetical protein